MVKKNFKRIVAMLILIVMFFPVVSAFALEVDQAGEIIAKFAYNYCKTLGIDSGNNQSIYSFASNRKFGYMLKTTSGAAERYKPGTNRTQTETKDFIDMYPIDCVGFVDMVIHQSLGIGNSDTLTFFITPQSESSYFERVTTGDKQPGDVYKNSEHVMIYLGSIGDTNSIADSISTDWQGPRLSNADTSSYTLYRIKKSYVEDVTPEECVTAPTGVDLSGNSASQLFGQNIEMSEWYYNGIPDGRYSVTGGVLDWIIEALKEILIFLIDIICYIVRMVFVGWTAIIENFTTWIIESITHETALDIDATSADTNDNITIEKIVFNKVKVFNVDFFSDTTEAGD